METSAFGSCSTSIDENSSCDDVQSFLIANRVSTEAATVLHGNKAHHFEYFS